MKIFRFVWVLSFISLISSIHADSLQLSNLSEEKVIPSLPLNLPAIPLKEEPSLQPAAGLVTSNNFDIYNEEQNSVYDQEQLEYIGRTVRQMTELFSKEDIFICPGRSCVHFSAPLKAQGYRIANPAFSKGHNVLNVARLSEHEDTEKNDSKQIELQEKVNNIPPDYLKDRSNLQKILKEFEDLPFYIDFETQEVRPADKFLLSQEQTEGYRGYLKGKCGVSPSLLGGIRGYIILFDSVCSGVGMGGFIKILLDWCKEERIDISQKIKVVNFNSRIREKPHFEGNNPLDAYWNSMINVIAPYTIWRKFSYNHIPTQSAHHFFFPPWTWGQPQLWSSLPSQTL